MTYSTGIARVVAVWLVCCIGGCATDASIRDGVATGLPLDVATELHLRLSRAARSSLVEAHYEGPLGKVGRELSNVESLRDADLLVWSIQAPGPVHREVLFYLAVVPDVRGTPDIRSIAIEGRRLGLALVNRPGSPGMDEPIVLLDGKTIREFLATVN